LAAHSAALEAIAAFSLCGRGSVVGLAALMNAKEETRRERRLKVFLPVAMIRESGPVRAHILDISNKGARLHATELVNHREKLTLEWEGRSIGARVAWVRGKRFGILFDQLLTNNQLVAMLAA